MNLGHGSKFKINCDGAVRVSDVRSACGGEVRDFQGHFIMGYACSLDPCDVNKVEIMAIFHGLKLAYEHGL